MVGAGTERHLLMCVDRLSNRELRLQMKFVERSQSAVAGISTILVSILNIAGVFINQWTLEENFQ